MSDTCDLEGLYFEILLVAIQHEPKCEVELIDGQFTALLKDMPQSASDAVLMGVLTKADSVSTIDLREATEQYSTAVGFSFQVEDSDTRDQIINAMIYRAENPSEATV